MARATGKAVAELVVEFTKERETKNTIRFAENSDDPVIGTLYVKKAAASKLGLNDELTVTLKAS